MKCRVSGKNTKELFNMGDLYVSDFTKSAFDDTYKSELKLMFCEESKILQLEKSVDSNKMYGKYWYRFGTNNTMKQQLKDIVDNCLYVKPNVKNGLWLDIACNDGTLLSMVPDNFYKLGIDPADNTYTNESREYADEIIQDFFSYNVYSKSKFRNKKCDVITCISMFYDLDNPIQFLKDVDDVLKDDGIFIVQMSYTPLMIQQMAFDNICHEHLMYYSLHSFNYLLNKSNFKIMDCQINDVNGGSFRMYLQKKKTSDSSFATAPYRDVCNYRINSLLEYENKIGANTCDFYNLFFNNLQILKKDVYSFVLKEKNKGKTIWGYGASTKGNTALQYFGLDNNLIDGIAERNSNKWGLQTVGTNIPIYSEDIMRNKKPDYLLILPWHFIEEFKLRESEYLDNNGKFIIICPKFEIYCNNK